MDFGFIGDAITAIVSGGATGLLGAGITAFTEFKKQQLIFKHEEVKFDHDKDMKKLNMEADSQKAEYHLKGVELETNAQIAVGDQEIFKEGIKNDKATYSSGTDSILLRVVDFVRGLVRPVLTGWFSYLAYRIYSDIEDKISSVTLTDTEQLVGLHQQITLMLLYVTTSVVLWWFGTRAKTQNPITFKLGKKE